MQKLSLDMELPLALGAAMVQRPEAAERFAALPEEERRSLVEQARSARSRQEMRACVDQLMK